MKSGVFLVAFCARLKTYGAFFGDKNHKAFSRFCLCGHEKSGLSNHKQTASTSLLGSASFSFDPANPEENEEVSELIKKNSELIFSLSLNVGGFLVRLYRGGTGEPKSPYTDDLQLLPGNDCKLSDNEKIEIGYTVVKKLKAIESGRTVGGKNSKEQEELASIHEATLSRLEELNEKLIFDSHEYRKNLETEHLSKLHALEEAFSTREQELTKNHQRLSPDFS